MPSVLDCAPRHRKQSGRQPATYVSSSPSWLLSADGYTLNDGSCACHKQWGWFTNACEGSFCYDYIGEAKQKVAWLCGRASPARAKRPGLPGRDMIDCTAKLI